MSTNSTRPLWYNWYRSIEARSRRRRHQAHLPGVHRQGGRNFWKEVPIVNSSLLEEAGEIVLHARHYHIGIAVSTPAGLVVPVIHDADQKDLSWIAAEIDQS